MTRERIARGDHELSLEHTGAPGGPAVLFLHGITGSADTWVEAMAHLGERGDGCECWALDFTGHGHSDRSATSPGLMDYVADASAALGHIGRPAILVGHSLGGITAAHLGHVGHPLVKATFLEDPPLFLTDPDVFAGTLYPKLFTLLRSAIAEMQAQGATPEAYLEVARNAPSPMGGVAADHATPRQVESRARQLQQFDPTVLDAAIEGRVFEGLDPHRPITCPVTLLAANEAYGAAMLEGDGDRLRRASPHAEVIAFPEVGHQVHGSAVSEQRFLDELDRFVGANR